MCKNDWKQEAMFPFVLLSSNNDNSMCSCILFALFGAWNSSEEVIHTRRKTSHSPKRIARAKACSSRCCGVIISGKLARNFSTCLKVSRRELSKKIFCKT